MKFLRTAVLKNVCERLRTVASLRIIVVNAQKNVEFQTDNVLLLLSNPGTYLVSKLLSVVLVSK